MLPHATLAKGKVSATPGTDAIITDMSEAYKKLDRKRLLVHENVNPNGSHADCFDGRLVSPGRGLQAMWHVMAVADRRDDAKLAGRCVDVVLNLLEVGWDQKFGGILNFIDGTGEGKVIEAIRKSDEVLCQKLQDLMFVFEDLKSIDDRGMQELLREVPGDKLILALKATDEELKQKFFKNMSERASQMLKDDLEAKGPVKLSEVEAAQKEILVTARRMAEEGRVQLGGKGGEEYV